MHCKDCKFWSSSGTCDRLDWDNDWDNDNRPADDDAVLLANASDDHGLCADLRTGPLFGCLKFQKA
jgi:hypothetical protein